jgi:hypothetical protein
MSIEQNFIFIYPLSDPLKQLKDYLEEDDTNEVYEIDSLKEYGQVVGIMEYSITFSGDTKKTESYLTNFKELVNTDKSCNFLIQGKTQPMHIKGKMKNLGLDHNLDLKTELTDLKELVSEFYSKAEKEVEEARIEAEKPKPLKTLGGAGGVGDSDAEEEAGSGGVKTLGQLKKEKEEARKARAQKPKALKPLTPLKGLGDIKQKKPTGPGKLKGIGDIGTGGNTGGMLSGKTKVNSGMDGIDGGMFSNFSMKKNGFKLPVLQSPFDKMQKRNLSTFKPALAIPKLKKQGTFSPISGELKNNLLKNVLDVKPPGELNRRKPRSDEFQESGELKKGVSKTFEESVSKLESKKKKSFEDQSEMGKGKGQIFEEVDPLQDRAKKPAFVDQTQLGEGDGKSFEDLSGALGKKSSDFKETDKNSKKKNTNIEFDGKKKSLSRRSGMLKEYEPELKKRKKIFDGANRMVANKLKSGEPDKELDKKKAEFEEVLLEIEAKRKQFEEVELELKRKSIELDKEKDPEKRKTIDLAMIELEKKHHGLFQDLKKRRPVWDGLLGEVLGWQKKKSHAFDEADMAKKKSIQFEEAYDWDKKKGIQFDEADISKKKKSFIEIEFPKKTMDGKIITIALDRSREEQELLNDGKKEHEIIIIDYRDFKKKVKTGELKVNQEQGEHMRQKLYQLDLEVDEINYFMPDSFGVEYLIIYNDLYHKEGIQAPHLFKLLHFALKKEFNAPISLYLNTTGESEDEYEPKDFEEVYNGHILANPFFSGDEFETYKEEFMPSWIKHRLPIFDDDTFQSDKNTFIYPFFEDGKYLGFGIVNFGAFENNHEDAKKIELLVMLGKGIIMHLYEEQKAK